MERLTAIGVRRVYTSVETITPADLEPIEFRYKRAFAAAVVSNPYRGHSAEEISALTDFGELLGDQLGREAIAALSCSSESCQSYGKGAIIGMDSSQEHAEAILHPTMGRALRKFIQRGKAIIPSTVKRGSPGARLDVPLHGIDDEWNFSLLDSIEVSVPGSPSCDEIIVVIAMTAGRKPSAYLDTARLR